MKAALLALGFALVGLLASGHAAMADVAVVGVNPGVAAPGERIVVRVGCGSCDPDVRFPISLVPAGRAPRPYPCEDGLCTPASVAPPRAPPLAFLGRTGRGRPASGYWRPWSESRLRFRAPDVAPGRYAFVVFCASCYRGPRGSLIADTSDPKLLRVRSGGDPHRAAPTPAVVAVAVTVALVIAVPLIFRRRGAG